MGAAATRAAVAVCALVLLTGTVGACGNGGSHGGPSARPTTKAPARAKSPARPARMLSQSELERAIAGPKDLPGWRVATVVGRGGDGQRVNPVIVDVSRVPRISPAACEPLYAMTHFLSRHQYRAIVEQTATTVSRKPERLVEVALTSYSVADAPKVLTDLRTSLRTCSSFVEPDTFDDHPNSWRGPRLLADPGVGDEAVSYRITQIVPSLDSNGDYDGGPPAEAPFVFTVVRSGATVAGFFANSFPHAPLPQIPVELVRTQIAKLERVE